MAQPMNLERLSIGTLRSVREVFVCKSVSLAARRLGVTQAAVSQQLARFEKLSGVQIFARGGGGLSPRANHAAALVELLVQTADSLGRVAAEKYRVRLGLTADTATYYSRNIDIFRIMEKEYDIYFSHSSDLAEMFSSGDLDIVIRPLYHHESETDYMTEIPVSWICPESAVGRPRYDEENPLPVILATKRSPYSYYIERTLRAAQIPYRVTARIDDHVIRANFVMADGGYTAVPNLVLPSLPSSIVQTEIILGIDGVRVGIFYNKRMISEKEIISLYDSIQSLIE